jgi:hypothetical protein
MAIPSGNALLGISAIQKTGKRDGGEENSTKK